MTTMVMTEASVRPRRDGGGGCGDDDQGDDD